MSVPMEEVQLPTKAVERLIKAHGYRIEKDAISGIVKAATVFVSYLAATAQEAAGEGYIFKLAPVPSPLGGGASGEAGSSSTSAVTAHKPYKTAKHKSILAQDIFQALDMLSLTKRSGDPASGALDYEEVLRTELAAFYAIAKRRKSDAAASTAARRKAQKEKQAAAVDGGEEEDGGGGGNDDDDDDDDAMDFAVAPSAGAPAAAAGDGPPTKRVKGQEGSSAMALDHEKTANAGEAMADGDEDEEMAEDEDDEGQGEEEPLRPQVLVQDILNRELEGPRLEDLDARTGEEED